MKIRREQIKSGTIEQFAEAYDLTMVVRERNLPVGDFNRYYASFEGAEVKDGAVLASEYGNGVSEDHAISSYARNISLKTLVFNAYGPNRREIKVWRLV